jgi:hypothetical protein
LIYAPILYFPFTRRSVEKLNELDLSHVAAKDAMAMKVSFAANHDENV